MDMEELGLIPPLDCEKLGCKMKCPFLPGQEIHCPVLGYANKMELDSSKANLLKEAELLVKGGKQ